MAEHSRQNTRCIDYLLKCLCCRRICCNGDDSNANDFQIRDSGRKHEIVRILMFGIGEVGKSTVIKQLQHLCLTQPSKFVMYEEDWSTPVEPYAEYKRQSKKPLVHQNVFRIIGTLLNKMDDFGLSFETEDIENRARNLRTIIEDVRTITQRVILLTPEAAEDIIAVWNDTITRQVWRRRREFHVSDSAQYFLQPSKLRDMASIDYIPTVDDILRARNPTTGVRDFNFKIEGIRFSIRDMGGQKEERGRFPFVADQWERDGRFNKHNNYDFILYVASLADYNQALPDPSENNKGAHTCLDQSVALFKVVMGIEELCKTGVIVFLNKEDVLEEKLQQFDDFRRYFPETQNQERVDLETAERVIARRFHEATAETLHSDNALYVKFTCATNVDHMGPIIAAVKLDIFAKYLQGGSIPFT